jgi:hypothetical protein
MNDWDFVGLKMVLNAMTVKEKSKLDKEAFT